MDDTSPGNYGLLDQVEALRWLQQNLAAFGGDVNQITLFGHDAGAASALYHLLSPLSKGMYVLFGDDKTELVRLRLMAKYFVSFRIISPNYCIEWFSCMRYLIAKKS